MYFQVPFGLTNGADTLYMTDWGLEGIYEVNMEENIVREFIIGIKRPTGITHASLRYESISKKMKLCKSLPISVDISCRFFNFGDSNDLTRVTLFLIVFKPNVF